MNNIFKIILTLFLTIFASCQEIKSRKSIVEIEIKDENGNLVSGAFVHGSNEVLVKNSPVLQSEYERMTATTDLAGKAIMNFSTYSELPTGVLIEKNGFYTTSQRITWTQDMLGKNPPTTAISAVLKKIRNPIYMHVANYTLASKEIEIFELNQTYDYDLQINEFLPPHGKGIHPDIKILVTGSNDGIGNAMIEMTIKASDIEGGFSSFEINDHDSGSYLKSDYSAAKDGYVNVIKFEFDSKNIHAYMNQDKKLNYYFKVRPRVNPSTGVKEWHYGKIYGPLSLWARRKDSSNYIASLNLNSIYFNPTPNDRNVECDTSKNLSSKKDEYNKPIRIHHP